MNNAVKYKITQRSRNASLWTDYLVWLYETITIITKTLYSHYLYDMRSDMQSE